jgi:hypothetical protein
MVTSPRNSVVRIALLVPFFALVACQSTPEHDLELNAESYRGSGYQTSHKQKRSVFIRNLRDRRGDLEPYAERQYPVVYTKDRYWARPLVVMLNGVFRKELSDAGIFASIVDKEEDADWVVEPVLLQFHGAVEQRVGGRKYRALSELHVTVWGERDATGQRPVLRQQKYKGSLDLGGETYSQINPYGLASASFARCMGTVLIDLDLGGQLADGISPKDPKNTDFEARTDWSPASTSKNR